MSLPVFREVPAFISSVTSSRLVSPRAARVSAAFSPAQPEPTTTVRTILSSTASTPFYSNYNL